MKFRNTKVMNFENAFRGLRNPLESWSKSDSEFGIFGEDDSYQETVSVAHQWIIDYNKKAEENNQKVIEDGSLEYCRLEESYIDWLMENSVLSSDDWNAKFDLALLGPKDLDLAQRMIKAGSSDRKFLRQIFVSVDITAPLYWWKQADTYKVATVANSTSTMHKLATTPITKDCFEIEDFNPNITVFDGEPYTPDYLMNDCADNIINICETLRKRYLQTKDKRYWKELIRWLPNGWLQTRTWTANYETLRNMYNQRKNHKLTEWRKNFCDWVKTLPYAEELILFN